MSINLQMVQTPNHSGVSLQLLVCASIKSLVNSSENNTLITLSLLAQPTPHHKLKFTRLQLTAQSYQLYHSFMGFIHQGQGLVLLLLIESIIYHHIRQIKPILQNKTMHYQMHINLWKWSWMLRLCLVIAPIMESILI